MCYTLFLVHLVLSPDIQSWSSFVAAARQCETPGSDLCITAGAYFRITFGSTQARVRCAWFQCGQHRRLRRRAGKQACMKRGWMQLNNLNHNVLNEADTSSHHSLGLLKSPLLRHKQYILIKYATKPLSARVGRAKMKEHCRTVSTGGDFDDLERAVILVFGI